MWAGPDSEGTCVRSDYGTEGWGFESLRARERHGQRLSPTLAVRCENCTRTILRGTALHEGGEGPDTARGPVPELRGSLYPQGVVGLRPPRMAKKIWTTQRSFATATSTGSGPMTGWRGGPARLVQNPTVLAPSARASPRSAAVTIWRSSMTGLWSAAGFKASMMSREGPGRGSASEVTYRVCHWVSSGCERSACVARVVVLGPEVRDAAASRVRGEHG
jgi:hypothetical protein